MVHRHSMSGNYFQSVSKVLPTAEVQFVIEIPKKSIYNL